MKKQSLLLVMLMLPLVASAEVVEIDGIYYNLNNKTAEVTKNPNMYTRSVIIPESVSYVGTDYIVTSIGDRAFEGCSSLTSITIPNSVTSIGDLAFYRCSGLTSIIVEAGNSIYDSRNNCNAIIQTSTNTLIVGCKNTIIPNSVTGIAYHAFDGCFRLYSITIPNSVTSIGEAAFHGCKGLTSVTIPNSVTSIGEAAFDNSGLTSITIPNSVTKIADWTFKDCTDLTSITISNSVTSIGMYAFGWCSSLTSITIPNSVTSIGNSAFMNCLGLTSITVPNSVTSIGSSAFWKCTALTSVTIGSGVTSIGNSAFDEADIPTVISLIENPFEIHGKTSDKKTFTLNTFIKGTLYVPMGTIERYETTEGWKDFVCIEESGTPPTPEKCEEPTIGYANGKLTFTSSTEGAICYYSITDTDIKAGSGSEVQLGVTYNISVYAAKVGYENSETTTATLCWIDATPQTEGITNGVAQIAARPVLVKTDNGFITVEGIDEGTQINAYTVNGVLAGSAVCRNGAAFVATNIQPGNTAIVKIGNKSVKVLVK